MSCARRSPDEATKDPGSIPGTSTANQVMPWPIGQGITASTCFAWIDLILFRLKYPDAVSGGEPFDEV